MDRSPDPKAEARKKALRAAKAVALGLALGVAGSVAGSVAGCANSHTVGTDAEVGVDARVTPDTGTPLNCEGDDRWMTQECCEEFGGIWDPSFGCGVPGPFVPPSMPA